MLKAKGGSIDRGRPLTMFKRAITLVGYKYVLGRLVVNQRLLLFLLSFRRPKTAAAAYDDDDAAVAAVVGGDTAAVAPPAPVDVAAAAAVALLWPSKLTLQPLSPKAALTLTGGGTR